MGQYGGYKRVVRYECTTCHRDHHERVADAANCCNEKAYEAERKAQLARKKRTMSRVAAPRVKFTREYRGGTLRAVATGKCPIRSCEYGHYEVGVRLQGDFGKRRTKGEASKQASALVRAMIARHVSARH